MKKHGYYSWIHTLKNAAMESHQRGIQLNEEKARKITDPTKQVELSKKLEPAKPVEHGKPEIEPTEVKIFAQELAKTGKVTPQSIAKAGGDVGAYVDLQKTKEAEQAAELEKLKGPIDAKPAGDANAVADDAEDGVVADPDTKYPSYSLAAQARAETAELEAQKAEEEEHEEKEEARYWSDYSGRTGEKVYESISEKINKLLNN
jgi:hypothetical protein